MGSRTVDRGIWFVLVDPVPRYPTIDNEVDEKAVDLDRSAPIRPDPVNLAAEYRCAAAQLNPPDTCRGITKPGPG